MTIGYRRQPLPGVSAPVRRRVTIEQLAALLDRQGAYGELTCIRCGYSFGRNEQPRVLWEDGQPVGLAHAGCEDVDG